MKPAIHKIDDIQRASIRRSEAYLRKKAAEPKPSGFIRDLIAGMVLGATLLLVTIILLSL